MEEDIQTRQAMRETEKRYGRLTDRQTDLQAGRQTERQMAETHTQTEKMDRYKDRQQEHIQRWKRFTDRQKERQAGMQTPDSHTGRQRDRWQKHR